MNLTDNKLLRTMGNTTYIFMFCKMSWKLKRPVHALNLAALAAICMYFLWQQTIYSTPNDIYIQSIVSPNSSFS